MMKKLWLVSLALIFIIQGILVIPVANAQAGPAVVKSTAKVNYPLGLDFSLVAQSNADIVDVRIRYSVEQESYADVISEASVAIKPARQVNVTWTLDMRRIGGLPPGTMLDYWWVIRDAGGASLETDAVRIEFADTRYSWKQVKEGLVTVYWYSGNAEFAGEIMTAAQEALKRLALETGARLNEPLRLYVYASSNDLLNALIFPYEWTGAVTYPQYDVILIGLEPANLDWGRSTIAHELSHVAVHQVTANPYSSLPTWLDEGLAMYNEGVIDVYFGTALMKAVKDDSLISIRSLASPFSALSDLAVLSYAESFSVVSYLISNYGKEKMLELLTVFSRGSTYDDALKKVYGFDVDGLNDLWREYVYKQFQPSGVQAALAGAPAG
jgi:hypothetical protein